MNRPELTQADREAIAELVTRGEPLPSTLKYSLFPLERNEYELVYDGKELAASVVDSGNADVEVHPGDWAILKVRDEVELPALHIDVKYPYDFAEPIFRLGNDYSKGIIVSTGYVGQRMDNGLISCLTDGHPGVSGGGVLDANGNLVGIPIGRMDGDYRFSFILPLRAEMFRKIPDLVTD